MRAVEKYYSVQEVSLLLGLHRKTVVDKMRGKEFGGEVVNLGSVDQPDYRIPASGVNEYLRRRRLFTECEDEPGVAARSVGELRRKAKV